MAVRLIAAMLLAAFSVTLASQELPPGHLTITVVDPTGASVPNAYVRFDPSPAEQPPEARTNLSGQVSLDLPPGIHSISIGAQGFSAWKGTVQIRSGDHQSIKATLNIWAGHPIVIQIRLDIPLEVLSTAEDIPLIPLRSLNVIGVKTRSHIAHKKQP